ncbi:MAG TPA: Fic family protein [Solirubrobacterales bacterium]|nr:Fic family protein [Solirubrobacterales bacterium]
MLFSTPPIKPDLQAQLAELEELRHTLGQETSGPLRWMGALRRSVRAGTIEGSVSIEGYSVSPEEAAALVSGEATAEPDDENRMAVACYARAMDHVGVLAEDPAFRWTDRVVLDLHFDACYFQPDKTPGRWRTGPIGVTGADGSLEYQGPDADMVPGLMAEVMAWLQDGDLDTDIVVRAAMAHLHVVSVHPFADGNGRLARIVQSLVLAREGLMSPEFSSIEEYLGEHTPAYYAALREAQDGGYKPERDASGWIAFCVDAHLAQARRRLAQIKEAAARWERLEKIVGARDWPERLVIALEQSLIGGTDRVRYGEEAGVSPATASADFRRLLDADLVEQQGRGRSTRYRAGKGLRAEAST